jgi:exonuclease SbcC
LKLLRLKLENFRQHQSTEVDFAEGMTAIVGPNGTGKTTLLEAITFALFGDTRGKVDDIKFFWAEGRTKYLARLTFSLGNRVFEVERSTYDASIKEVSGTERVWATGKRETAEKCESLLGLNYEQFINSFCAEQKALRFLNFKTDRDRQAEVARMLGYDKLELAESLATERRKDFGKERTFLERELRDQMALEAEKKLAQEKLEEAKKRSAYGKQEKKNLEATVPQVKERASRGALWLELAQQMDVLFETGKALHKNRKTTEDALAEATKEVEELALLAPVESDYQQVCKSLEDLARAYETHLKREQLAKEAEACLRDAELVNKQLVDLGAPDLKPREQAVQEAIKLHSQRQSECDSAQKQWADSRVKAQAELSGAKAVSHRADEDLKTAMEMVAKGKCPECGQPITASYEEILQSRRNLVAASKEALAAAEVAAKAAENKPKTLVDAEVAMQQAVEKHRIAQAAYEEARNLGGKATILREQEQALTKKHQALILTLSKLVVQGDFSLRPALEAKKKDLDPKHSRYLAIQNAPGKAEKCKAAHEAAKKEHEDAREQYRALEKQRTDLSLASREEATAAVEAFRQLQTQIDLLTKDLALAAEQEGNAKRELDAANKAIAEQKERKKQIEELRQRELLHSTTAAELKNLRLHLNAELGPELAARASENISLLTNGRYSQISLDKNFGAALYDDGDVHKPVISGGEEDVVALSLRLALSELIQERQGRPMSLLILDEVFGSLDVDRRHCVMDRLSALKGRFEQILVISHIEEINQVADQCLYLSRDAQTRSTTVTDAPLLEFAEL